MKQKQPHLSRTIATYALGRIFRQVLGIVTSLLRPRLLGPELFGFWTLIKPLLRYATYSDLGTRSAMRLLVPRLDSEGKTEESEAQIQTAFAISLLLNSAVAAGAILYGILGPLSPAAALAFMLCGALVMAQFFYEFAVTVLRARERFDLVTRSYYLTASLLLAGTLLLFLAPSLSLLLLSVLAAHLATTFYLASGCRFSLKPHLARSRAAALLRDGFPIMLSDLCVLLVTTSDRLVIFVMLGEEPLGFYGIATLMMSFLMNVPGTAREVMEPRLMSSMEKGGERYLVNNYVLTPLVNTAFLMTYPVACGVFLIPPVIRLVLPAYAPGIHACQMLLIASYYVALVYPLRTVIMARGWQARSLPLLGGVLVLNLLLCLAAGACGLGIVGIAAASGISALLMCVALLCFIARRLENPGPQWNVHLLGAFSVLPVVAVMTGLAALPGGLANSPEPLWISLARATAVGAAVLLLHCAAARRLPLLNAPPLSFLRRRA